MDDDRVRRYLDGLRHLLLETETPGIRDTIDLLLQAFRDDRSVFVLGNGGSATTASHFACDLGKGVPGVNGRRFKVISLTDNVALLTAWANDVAYDRVFAEQLSNLVQPGDVVVAISGSGNSPNVLRAMELARSRGATTVGWTGFQGGALKSLCDVCVVVPSNEMDQIENVHVAIEHLVCCVIREVLAEWTASSELHLTGAVTGAS